MLKFIKNFFQKKELWIFASYVGIDYKIKECRKNNK